MTEIETEPTAKRLQIGVSACLLGEKVRFDSGHKHDRWVTEVLGHYFDFVSVCPEVEIGLGIPRETIRLEQSGAAVRLVAPKSGIDLTAKMTAYAHKRSAGIARQHLCGFILKKDSPTCGMERVRVYDRHGVPARAGRGLFAAALLERCPSLPVEGEGRLNDPRLRENFVSRIYAYSRWLEMAAHGITRAELYRFHERHKYVLMAHSQMGLRRLGRLLATAGRRPDVRELAQTYLAEFTAVMARVPSTKNHTNVLQHLAGYFSGSIDPGDRAELSQTIHEYRLDRLPLIVPVTLLRHYVRKLQVSYLPDQVYLNPHPEELMLLNHV